MIAPFEKHLEDWIAVNGMPEITERSFMYDILIGRQVKLPHGIADLIYTDNHGINVVELKKGAIDELTVHQVLRYQCDLTGMWEFFTDTRPRISNEFPYYGNSPVSSSVIGYSIDLKTMLACEAAGIWAWVYSYDDISDEYQFEWQCSADWQKKEQIYGMPELRQAMLTIYLNRLKATGQFVAGMSVKGTHNE